MAGAPPPLLPAAMARVLWLLQQVQDSTDLSRTAPRHSRHPGGAVPLQEPVQRQQQRMCQEVR